MIVLIDSQPLTVREKMRACTIFYPIYDARNNSGLTLDKLIFWNLKAVSEKKNTTCFFFFYLRFC